MWHWTRKDRWYTERKFERYLISISFLHYTLCFMWTYNLPVVTDELNLSDSDSDPFLKFLPESRPISNSGELDFDEISLLGHFFCRTFEAKRSMNRVKNRKKTWDQFELEFSSWWWRCFTSIRSCPTFFPHFFPGNKKSATTLKSIFQAVILGCGRGFPGPSESLFCHLFFFEHWIMNIVFLISRKIQGVVSVLRNRSQLVMRQ